MEKGFVVMATGCLVWGTSETDRQATMVLAGWTRQEAATNAATGKNNIQVLKGGDNHG